MPRSRRRANFSGRHELDHLEVAFGRLQVLTHREDIDAGCARIVHRLFDFGFGFAESEHQRGLGVTDFAALLRVCEHRERPARTSRAGSRTLGCRRSTVSRLCSQHFGLRVEHDVEILQVAGEIAGQTFDLRARRFLVDLAHRICENRRAEIGEIIAVDGRQHKIIPAEFGHGFGDALGLEPIDFALRRTGLDVAEMAAARARVAEDHDRRGSGTPALGEVRAHRFLAHRIELEALHVGLDVLVRFAAGQLHLEPRGLALWRLRADQIDGFHGSLISTPQGRVRLREGARR